MKLLIGHQTARGPVYIGKRADEMFCVIWNDENLGPYASVRLAVSDAAGGHTFAPSDGTDLSSLGISDDEADWVSASLLG